MYVEINLHVTFSWRSREGLFQNLSSIKMPDERDFFNQVSNDRTGKCNGALLVSVFVTGRLK